MSLRSVIAASLAAVPLACDSSPKKFEVDAQVQEAEVRERFASERDKPVEQIDCDKVCWFGLRDKEGHNRVDIKRLTQCDFEPSDVERVHVTCSGVFVTYTEGRRPWAELDDEPCPPPGAELGTILAELAYLEAASIHAFVELAAQLQNFGAPPELRDRCHAAAQDERRHASVLARLARTRGAEVVDEPRALEREPPTLEQLALHNAVEGCVHESFAALLARVRALGAGDPVIRAAYRTIAEDELRHGQLAWDIHAWVIERLDPAARARVIAARSRALAQLPARARALAELPAQLQRISADAAERVAREFADRLARAA